jgi:predicted RNase H-like nuclease (RuvC/YqgF family)
MSAIKTPKADWVSQWSSPEWSNVEYQRLAIITIQGLEEQLADLELLEEENDTLKSRCARQERYIKELEKQLELLQKTLDLIDKNRGETNG